MEMSGKVVLITGASRGIGAAAARAFADTGAKVMLSARSEAEIKENAARIEASGGTAVAMTCDVADYASVAALVAATIERFGRLDVLVNNAGVIDPVARIEDSDPAAWAQVVDINLKGVFYGMRASFGLLQANGGVVINLSSGAATSALEGWSHYCATKAGVYSLTRVGHREWAERGVRVIGLSPGTVATDMQTVIKASGINPVSQLDPSVHIPAEWVGRAIVWLSTPEASEFDGTDVSLRDPDIRARIGLPV